MALPYWIFSIGTNLSSLADSRWILKVFITISTTFVRPTANVALKLSVFTICDLIIGIIKISACICMNKLLFVIPPSLAVNCTELNVPPQPLWFLKYYVFETKLILTSSCYLCLCWTVYSINPIMYSPTSLRTPIWCLCPFQIWYKIQPFIAAAIHANSLLEELIVSATERREILQG